MSRTRPRTARAERPPPAQRCCGAPRRSPLRRLSRENDRFLVIDDKELYLIGASLKDLGRKCFGFTKMDASEIPGLKARM